MLKGGYRGVSPLNNSSPPLYIYINIYILVPPPSRSLDPLLFEAREKRKEAKEKREGPNNEEIYCVYFSYSKGDRGSPPLCPPRTNVLHPHTPPSMAYFMAIRYLYIFSMFKLSVSPHPAIRSSRLRGRRRSKPSIIGWSFFSAKGIKGLI